MRRATIPVLLLLGLASAALTARQLRSAPLTKDRLDDEHMHKLVSKPLAEFLAKKTEQGLEDFEKLLVERRREAGNESTLVADTLVSMGVTLYSAATQADDEQLQRTAIAYMRRAISAVRGVFGSDDPEVALAESDYANATINIDPKSATPELEAILDDALRIRSARLGPANTETGDSLEALARVKGLRAATGGDPAKIAAARNLFERAIAVGEKNASTEPNVLALYYLHAAEFFGRYGDLARAMSYFDAMKTIYMEALKGEQASASIAMGALVLAEELRGAVHPAEADALRRQYGSEIEALVKQAQPSRGEPGKW